MRRREQLQGLRLMKLEGAYGWSLRGELSQPEAAEILGSRSGRFGAAGPRQGRRKAGGVDAVARTEDRL